MMASLSNSINIYNVVKCMRERERQRERERDCDCAIPLKNKAFA